MLCNSSATTITKTSKEEGRRRHQSTRRGGKSVQQREGGWQDSRYINTRYFSFPQHLCSKWHDMHREGETALGVENSLSCSNADDTYCNFQSEITLKPTFGIE
jgi:hypothetical protein